MSVMLPWRGHQLGTLPSTHENSDHEKSAGTAQGRPDNKNTDRPTVRQDARRLERQTTAGLVDGDGRRQAGTG